MFDLTVPASDMAAFEAAFASSAATGSSSASPSSSSASLASPSPAGPSPASPSSNRLQAADPAPDSLERETARILKRGASLIAAANPDRNALLAAADDLNRLVERLTAEKTRIGAQLLTYATRIRAAHAYGR